MSGALTEIRNPPTQSPTPTPDSMAGAFLLPHEAEWLKIFMERMLSTPTLAAAYPWLLADGKTWVGVRKAFAEWIDLLQRITPAQMHRCVGLKRVGV